MKRTVFILLILTLLVPLSWLSIDTVGASFILPMFMAKAKTAGASRLATTGTWNTHPYDMVYTVAFSSEQQPNGPLVVYRASATDLHTTVPVISLARAPQIATPLFFPSPNGQYLALLTPITTGTGTSLNSEQLRVLSTTGTGTPLSKRGATGTRVGAQITRVGASPTPTSRDSVGEAEPSVGARFIAPASPLRVPWFNFSLWVP